MFLQALAKRNQEYYLKEMKGDNYKNEWYRYVKSLDNYAEPVLITPEMANSFLQKFKATPEDIKQVVESWKEQYSTIAISFFGKVLDGYKVLEAIITINESTIVFCSFNISEKFLKQLNKGE